MTDDDDVENRKRLRLRHRLGRLGVLALVLGLWPMAHRVPD